MEEDKNWFQCGICQKKFSVIFNFYEHFKEHGLECLYSPDKQLGKFLHGCCASLPSDNSHTMGSSLEGGGHTPIEGELIKNCGLLNLLYSRQEETGHSEGTSTGEQQQCSQVGERPGYKCAACKQVFPALCTLKAHLNGESFYYCEDTMTCIPRTLSCCFSTEFNFYISVQLHRRNEDKDVEDGVEPSIDSNSKCDEVIDYSRSCKYDPCSASLATSKDTDTIDDPSDEANNEVGHAKYQKRKYTSSCLSSLYGNVTDKDFTATLIANVDNYSADVISDTRKELALQDDGKKANAKSVIKCTEMCPKHCFSVDNDKHGQPIGKTSKGKKKRGRPLKTECELKHPRKLKRKNAEAVKKPRKRTEKSNKQGRDKLDKSMLERLGCYHCGKFFLKNNLENHIKACTMDRQFSCDVCGAKFATQGAVKSHQKCVHQKANKYQCEFCGASFFVPSKLAKHLRNHTGERNFVCSYCNKTFKHEEYLRKHQKIHTGIKDQVCSTCGKMFYSQWNLRQHELTHREVGAFVCARCNRNFTTRRSLKKHQEITRCNDDVDQVPGDGQYPTSSSMVKAGDCLKPSNSTMFKADDCLKPSNSTMYKAGDHLKPSNSTMYKAGDHLKPVNSTMYKAGDCLKQVNSQPESSNRNFFLYFNPLNHINDYGHH